MGLAGSSHGHRALDLLGSDIADFLIVTDLAGVVFGDWIGHGVASFGGESVPGRQAVIQENKRMKSA